VIPTRSAKAKANKILTINKASKKVGSSQPKNLTQQHKEADHFTQTKNR
jgi:hypothetical protein